MIHIQWGGGGGSSRIFPGSMLCGVAEFFPLTTVTDPKFVLFKHVLCFARIMSTLCPNSCRQTARIDGGGNCPPCPPRPVRLCQYMCQVTHVTDLMFIMFLCLFNNQIVSGDVLVTASV